MWLVRNDGNDAAFGDSVVARAFPFDGIGLFGELLVAEIHGEGEVHRLAGLVVGVLAIQLRREFDLGSIDADNGELLEIFEFADDKDLSVFVVSGGAGEGPVRMFSRVVADAEVRSAAAVIVEGENGLLFQVVVNLHGAVPGILFIAAVAEIILAVVRAGNLLGVVWAVVALPEFDVSFFECSGFNAGDVGGDGQICDIVRNDSGCFGGDADGGEVLGERVHLRISPGLLVLVVREFDEVADSLEFSGKTFDVVDFISVLEIRFRIEFVDELETFCFGHWHDQRVEEVHVAL